MRFRMIGVVGLAALALASCGSVGGKAATELRSPNPVNLTVYVNDSRVSVSPTSVGAGPVVFIVTNQASGAETLSVSRAGQTQPVASTAPINPQGTTSFSVNFRPGDYTLAIGGQSGNDAQRSVTASIRPASIHIGRERGSSSNTLLQP